METAGDDGIGPELMAFLRRIPPPRAPSRRQPNQEWSFNEADKIERLMQADGHITWGYVIYRTTYENDDDWDEFLRRLRFHLEATFDRCNGRDILEANPLTVFSDRALFDGANTTAIRSSFRAWVETAYLTEQTPQKARDMPVGSGSAGQVGMGKSPRYHFCIQVDQESLLSVIHDAPAPPAPDATKKGWVKLISKSWIPIAEDPLARPEQNIYEPIEGITERDVGWQKVPYTRVMTEYYSGSEGMNGWRTEYCRPPEVVGPPWD